MSCPSTKVTTEGRATLPIRKTEATAPHLLVRFVHLQIGEKRDDHGRKVRTE
jgi:hypothetical protein